MDKKLTSIKNYLNQADTLLNYVQFKSLMENINGVKNPRNKVLEYTDDIEKFIKSSREIHQRTHLP